jgi:hypothetical protein
VCEPEQLPAAEFKRRVLDPIATEFKAIGYGATWQPVRTGKKTTSLRFSFPRNREKTTNATPRSTADLRVPAKLSLGNERERFYQKLSDAYGLAAWQVQVVTYYLQEGDEELQFKRFANVTDCLNSLDKARIKTALGGYVWSCVTTKFPYMKTIAKNLYPKA